LQEVNVSRPIFTKTTLVIAKVRSTMFGDPKLQFSPVLQLLIKRFRVCLVATTWMTIWVILIHVACLCAISLLILRCMIRNKN
jgi:branched-subunit amino acid ABC-type transport system permease component